MSRHSEDARLEAIRCVLVYRLSTREAERRTGVPRSAVSRAVGRFLREHAHDLTLARALLDPEIHDLAAPEPS